MDLNKVITRIQVNSLPHNGEDVTQSIWDHKSNRLSLPLYYCKKHSEREHTDNKTYVIKPNSYPES
jgi:hypothetical protein